jgi:hypothetical protein
MTEIEKVKGEIKVLEKKLALLEEIETHKSLPKMSLENEGKFEVVSYNDEIYYRLEYPTDVIWYKRKEKLDGILLKQITDAETKRLLEMMYLADVYVKKEFQPSPQTPEQTAQSLKEAFVEAQKTEKWKEIQNLIDEEDNDKNFKNSLDLIKEWGEKNKPPTLYEILMEWWINHLDMEQSDEEIIGGLVDRIDKQFIPPSHDTNGYEWEKCLKIMREKLR